MMEKCAIFVDFDNVFSALWELDEDAADRFASAPGDWLKSLACAHLNDGPRRWLVARCYFNPGGYVSAPGEPKDRLYFSRYRVGLVRAGFDVVDCPSIARGGKNAADIRIVIDVLSLLDHRTRFDEFVIASGDSDFTPLLQRLRAEDRRTTVVSPGFLAAAYTASADMVVDYDALQQLLEGMGPIETEVSPPGSTNNELATGQAQFSELVRRRYMETRGPLSLATLASEVNRSVSEARATGWFGQGSFSKALMALDLPNAQFSQHHLWDDERHQSPAAYAAEMELELPPAQKLILQSLDIPRVSRNDWPKVFRVISAYTDSHKFNLTEATRWCRDALAYEGVQIARVAIGFVIRGMQIGGLKLNGSSLNADDVGKAFLTSILERAASLAMPLDDEAAESVRDWLGVSLPEASANLSALASPSDPRIEQDTEIEVSRGQGSAEAH